MSQVHYFEFVTSVSNPEEAQICVPYKYMVIHLKCYKILFWQPSWMPFLIFKPESIN